MQNMTHSGYQPLREQAFAVSPSGRTMADMSTMDAQARAEISSRRSVKTLSGIANSYNGEWWWCGQQTYA
jgi:hypothetical protein